MKKIGNDSIVTACSQRVSAIKKHLGARDELYVNGERVKAGDVAQTFQEALDTRAAVVTAKGGYKSALVARGSADTQRVLADAALEPYVVQRFGANSTEAHDFGYGPKKVADRSAANKAKAVLLNKATRDARGTTGKRAKQQIKGTLTPEAAAALEALSASSASSAPVSGAAAAAVVTSTSVASAPAVAPAAVVANGASLNGAAHS